MIPRLVFVVKPDNNQMVSWILQSLKKMKIKEGVFLDTIVQADLPHSDEDVKVSIEGEEEFDDDEEIVFDDENFSICLF